MRARTTTALVLLLALTACGGPRGNPSEEPSGAPATPGGPSDDPVAVEPTAALLDWQDTGTEAGTRYLKGPEWEALGNEAGTRVDLQADGTSVGIAAGRDRTISEVLMSEDWAVVVRQDKAETAPSRVAVVDLATGEQGEVTTPPLAGGGVVTSGTRRSSTAPTAWRPTRWPTATARTAGARLTTPATRGSRRVTSASG